MIATGMVSNVDKLSKGKISNMDVLYKWKERIGSSAHVWAEVMDDRYTCISFVKVSNGKKYTGTIPKGWRRKIKWLPPQKSSFL